MNRWRVGEDRGSKETDGCPLITTFGESTSGKSSDFEYRSHRLWVWSLEMVQRCGENTYEQGESRRGEVRKQMDVPLHYPPFKSMVRITRRLPGLL
jgi:hypothetical protein